jgi:hypothetical protein
MKATAFCERKEEGFIETWSGVAFSMMTKYEGLQGLEIAWVIITTSAF